MPSLILMDVNTKM